MEETLTGVTAQSSQQDEQNEGPGRVPDEDGDVQSGRRRRVQEYHAHVLAKEDPLQAVLGSLNAGLMEIGMTLDQAINENLTAGPVTIGQIMQYAAAVELQLKLARQIDRFAQLEIRSATKSTEGREDHPNIPR